MAFSLIAQFFFNVYIGVALALMHALMETKHDNGVRKYEDTAAVKEISWLIVKYFFI